MRENRDFVVPVNILTTLRTPRFLGPHDTLPCVLIMTYLCNLCVFLYYCVLLVCMQEISVYTE